MSWVGPGRALWVRGFAPSTLVAVLCLGVPGFALAQEPPDTVQVDSTRLRIQQRLQGLAKPPGIDSIYFLPDSLLPDSILEQRAALGGRPGQRRTQARAGGEGLAGGDSLLMALKGLEGYAITEYQAQGADFGAKDRQLVLRGTPDDQARIITDGQQLTADTLMYSEETGKVWTLGTQASVVPEGGEPVAASVIVFDLDEERGTALNARTTYDDWIVFGELRSVTGESSWGHDLAFTTCELEEPHTHYYFKSRNVKIVGGNVLVARPVTLNFGGVPVAWLPFMAQSLSRDRASGLLTPTFSINDIVRTSRSYRRRISNIGFYWALSDYYDATMFLDWWSGEHLALTSNVRYNWARQFLQGGLSFRRFWREGGSKELAVTGNTGWEMSERTKLRFRGSYASSTAMVRETSFDPREVVQSIDSEGGLNHRFGFGNLSLSANRRQFLSDDRVEMTLPNLSFSLSPQTLFRAPPSTARFYNNITWSGSASVRRSISDRPEQADTALFNRSLADQTKTNASLNSGISLGNLSLSSGMTLSETVQMGIPSVIEPIGKLAPVPFGGREDQGVSELTWNASLGYQQRLIGSTTLTPSLSFSRRFLQADTSSLASSYVGAPMRLSLGINLKTEIYGFFPGFGSFDAIRHKVTPGFDFSYAPKVSPTDLQSQVFGSREVGAQRVLRISLNQTFEARPKDDPAAQQTAGPQGQLPPGAAVPDSLRGLLPDTAAMAGDTLAVDSLGVAFAQGDSLGGPQSVQPGRKVTLLALRTTAVSYDFERAAEEGNWLWGLTTTQLTNNVSSDYLRGLNLSMTHDLFEDDLSGSTEGSGKPSRKFSPHLSQMNFGFSLDSQSLPFRVLRSLLGMGGEGDPSTVEASAGPAGPEDNPFAPSLTDESTVIPGGGDPSVSAGRGGGGRGGSGGGWRANLSYSLQRPRSSTSPSNQMLQSTLTFDPTESWGVSWRTSYDIAKGSFNDHLIRLTRDLHRWQAYFDFRQTATGNWSFRFEVALTDNDDLKFDYVQRSIQDRTGFRR